MDAKLIDFLREGTPIRFKPYYGEWADAVVIKGKERKIVLYTQNNNNVGHCADFDLGDIVLGHSIRENCWFPEIDDVFELAEDVQLKNY